MFRTDLAQLPRVTRTPEGYLRGDAIVTRVGVFKYQNADGSIRAELRHPDDVLNDSLKSLRMVPITIDHPDEPVSVANAARYSVGSTGEYVRRDGNNVIVPLTITHADAIRAVSSGKRELSLGYSLDLIREDGVYEGERYTHRQTNITYNHLAIVDVARAGQAARLNLDGGSMFNRNDAIEAIARRCPNSDTGQKLFLETKSDAYLAARLAAMTKDSGPLGTSARQQDYDGARYDGYGRAIPGTLPMTGASRADAEAADAAYQKSKADLNAWRNAPVVASHDTAGRGDSVVASAQSVHADAMAEEEAYRKSVADLNAWRNR